MEDTAAQTWEMMNQSDWYFRKMVRRFIKERDKISVGGITLPTMLILHKICQSGACRLSDLAAEFDFTSGAITGICDKLEKKRFACRVRQTDDRRAVFLQITEKGRQMHMQYRAVGWRCIKALFAGLTNEEITAQAELCQKILKNLETFSQTVLQTVQDCEVDSNTTENPPPSSQYLSY
ncbi:MAG: MarR family transcriptional regulator [Ethanoligenens sp.]